MFAAAQEYGYSKTFLRSIIGTGEKRLAPAEKENYGRTNRSLHYVTDLAAGSVLKESDIAILRTEKTLRPGESPALLPHFIGAVLQQDVAGGEGALVGDIIRKGMQ